MFTFIKILLILSLPVLFFLLGCILAKLCNGPSTWSHDGNSVGSNSQIKRKCHIPITTDTSCNVVNDPYSPLWNNSHGPGPGIHGPGPH